MNDSIVVPQEGQSEASAEKISDSADIDQHTKTNALKVSNMADEADHQEPGRTPHEGTVPGAPRYW